MEASLERGMDGGWVVLLKLPGNYYRYIRPDLESALKLIRDWDEGRVDLHGVISEKAA